MKLLIRIPAYIFGIILIVVMAGAYVYYFTTLPESELNNWIGSIFSSGKDIEINVRKVNRDIWDRLEFEEITVSPPKQAHVPIIYISKIELDYDITELIRGRSIYNSLLIDSISIEFPQVEAKNNAQAGDKKFTIPVSASINRVYIHSIEVVLPNGEQITANDLAFSVSAEDDHIEVTLDNFSGRWDERNFEVYSIAGDLSYGIEGLSIGKLDIQTGRSQLSISGKLGPDIINNIDLEFSTFPLDLEDVRNLTGVKINGNLQAKGALKGAFTDFSGNVVVDGTFMKKQFDNVNIEYRFSEKELEISSVMGNIFKAYFEGSGKLDFSTRPETFSYNGKLEHLNLQNIGPDLETEFTGTVEMRGEGLAEHSLRMEINCALDSVWIDDYYFDSAYGPFAFDLRKIEFLEGFGARYKHTTLSGAGSLEYNGEIDLTGDVEFDDLTDFTDQIFLKKLGGKGMADFHVYGPTLDFSVDAFFTSDSCWTYGLEPGELFLNASLQSFISHRVGTVNGRWTGGTVYSVSTDSGFFETSISGERVFIDTTFVAGLGGGLWMKGNFDGTTVPPVFRIDTLSADIYGNRLYSDSALVFSIYEKETEFNRFRLKYGSGIVGLSGIVTTDLELELDFNADGFQIQPILEQIYPDKTIEGIWSGNAKLRGDFENPIIESSINIDSVKINGVFIGNLATNAEYYDRYLYTREGSLISPDGSYQFSGKLPMDLAFDEVSNRFPDAPIDLHLTATGSRLVLSELFISTVERFNTDFDFDLSFTGNYSKPMITGNSTISSGELKTLDLKTPLTNVNAAIRMQNETIFIDSASATVSEPESVDKVLKNLFSGLKNKKQRPIVTAHGTIKLMGLGEFLYDIDVNGKDFFFISDQFNISGISDFNLRINGATPPVVSGDIVITKLDIRNDFESFYDPEFQVEDAVIEDSLLWNLDLNIRAQNNIWIKNKEVDSEFKADVRVQRNVGIYGILGTLEVIRGSYYLVGQKFRVESGLLTYQDVAGIDPEIDFIVSTPFEGPGGRSFCYEGGFEYYRNFV